MQQNNMDYSNQKDIISQPFWSVMIPSYRPKYDYLRQTLESVLQQDPGSDQMQIEVVDDCSPDVDVAEMVKAIAGDRVTVSKTLQNMGLAGCWNTCAARAEGEWVHILHQDDWILEGFYQTLENAASKNPEIGFMATRTYFANDDGVLSRASPRMINLEVSGRCVDDLLHINHIQCPSVVVKRKYYASNEGFRNDLKYTLDVEMWTRVISTMGGIILPEILACYRQSTTNESERLARTGKYLKDTKDLHEIYAKRYPSFNRKKAMWRLCHQALDHAERFNKLGDKEAEKINRDFWESNSWPTLRLYRFARKMALFILNRK